MKLIIVIIALLVFLGCNKAESDKLSSQNPEFSTEDSEVKQVENKETVKNYKKGDAIELYDLLYSLLPEENNVDNIKWGKEDEQKAINWLGDIACLDNSCTKEGKVKILMNKEYFEWGVYIEGDKSGYFKIGLGYEIVGEFQKRPDVDITNLDSLFSNNSFESTIINNSGYGDGEYLVNFKNKKPFWLRMSYEAGKRYEYFSIDCYIDEKHMSNDDNNY